MLEWRLRLCHTHAVPSSPTLADVAAAAGVSTATASYALRDDSRVRPETRRRVREQAARLGYRSNRLAAALASHRFSQAARLRGLPIALVHHIASKHREQFWPRATAAIARRHAHALGYAFETHNLASGRRLDSLFREFDHRGVGGILIGRFDRHVPGLENYLQNYPTVACAGDAGGLLPHLIRVQYDVARSVDRAFVRALERGYRRIGAVMIRHETPEPIGDDLRRLGAAYARMRAHPETEWIEPYYGWIMDTAAVGRWYRRHRPDCILAFNAATYHHARDAGARIPERCGFVAANLQLGDANRIDITGYQESKADLARIAIETLDQRIRHRQLGNPPPSHRLIVDPIWRAGSTLPPR